MRPRPGRVATVVAGLIALLSATALAQGGPEGPAPSASDCVIPDDQRLASRESVAEAANYAYQDWAASPEAQASIEQINKEIEATFDAAADADALSRGLIGLTLDHHAQEVVVVVDPTLVNDAALERDVEQAAEPSVEVRVSAGCNSAVELLATRHLIDSQAWSQDASKASYGWYLDPKTSTFAVTFAHEDQAAAEALAAGAKGTVTVAVGDVVRRSGGRLNDDEPHWGGAAIGFPGDRVCTSGFTVILNGGGRGSVTAGHCPLPQGTDIFSGSQFYGNAHDRDDYPTHDLRRIGPGGQSFSKRIHVDPCCPNAREVVADHNPSVGDFVCVSGFVTRAVCGLEVLNTSYTFCGGGCTPNLFKARKLGEVVGNLGDSGAPVYQRFGSDDAQIMGLEIGGTSPNNVVAHKISTVKNHLNVETLK